VRDLVRALALELREQVTDAHGRSLSDRPLLGCRAEFQMSVVAAAKAALHERVLAIVDDGVGRVSG
jgi:hypothetical protein